MKALHNIPHDCDCDVVATAGNVQSGGDFMRRSPF